MASLRVDFPSFSLILLFSVVSSALGGVPVLLWESSSVSEKEDVVPALNQLDGDEFSSHLIKKVHTHKPLIVVFVEETLSVEDFSWKDDKHQGAFPKLENITGMAAKMEFIPSVIDPVSALKDLVHSQGYSYLKFDRSTPKNKPRTALEVALSDPFITEDRPQLLRRHDADVTRIYSDLLASAPHIVAIFTGRQNSWVEADVNRVRRQANSSQDDSLKWSPGGAMINAKSAKLTVNNRTYDLGPGEVKLDDREKNNYVRIIYSTVDGAEKTKIVLRIRFNLEKSGWNIGDSEVEVAGKTYGTIAPTTKVSSPIGKSFSADSVTLESSAKDVTLVFSGFQAEKFKKLGQTTFSVAATSGNQFFTGPIWMGLFVSWTMLIILAWGIMMLMDIKTMDRFDDPKGKTISVNVTE